MAGFYSQAIPAPDDAQPSLPSRQPCGPDEDDLSAATSDDADDAFDDFLSLDYTLNWSPSDAALLGLRRKELTIFAWHCSTSATLTSQHTLLRL
jgi:hypothetical protein